jgi:hypothetical protein
MEVLTPERADDLERLVTGLGTCFAMNQEPLRSELAKLGRFAEPALEHMLRSRPNSECRPQLTALLEELKEAKE